MTSSPSTSVKRKMPSFQQFLDSVHCGCPTAKTIGILQERLVQGSVAYLLYILITCWNNAFLWSGWYVMWQGHCCHGNSESSYTQCVNNHLSTMHKLPLAYLCKIATYSHQLLKYYIFMKWLTCDVARSLCCHESSCDTICRIFIWQQLF